MSQSNSPRINFPQVVPALYKGFLGIGETLKDSSLGKELIDLVFLRVSLINGCAFCVDMHWRDLISLKADPRRLNSISTWREHSLFNPRECAALQWAESLTRMSQTHIPDADYEALKEHFNEKEIAELTFTVALINAWNRISGGLRSPLPAK
ncbi:MAG TPA: carboxymuconolactone decarboxylase family protein [Burkholderiales bacterium]|jgi:AhpD family alkylhydroperoxidase|nr:carboxymuconolactone decarboxylase family protein [Burkholderiales bacterium]